MEVIIENEITISEASEEIKEYCRRNFVIENPEWHKKKKLGLYVGNVPRKLQLYKKNGSAVVIPIGLFREIKRFIGKDTKIDIRLNDDKRVEYDVCIPLYDYQINAVEAMKKKGFGILAAPAGSGKTQMGIALIVQLGYKALWLTHTQDLLTQSYNRARKYIAEDKLGRITAGKIDIGEYITFATVQTLAKQDLTQFKNEFNVIIADECHRAAGTPTRVMQFGKVISNIAARHKIGLTATVHRSDGMIKAMFALLGGIGYSVLREDVEGKIISARIIRVNTETEISEGCLDVDGTIVYNKLIEHIVNDEERNRLIVDNLVENVDNGCIVLSARVKHLKSLMEYLPGDMKEKAALVDGSMKKEREEIIEEMKCGRKKILFATYNLAKEGLDIPCLNRLFMATPVKDYTVVVQSIGRICRAYEGKGEAVCYDFVDNAEYFEKMYKMRCTSYRKCGCVF